MLVAVALHDREELVQPCLDSLRELAGMGFRLAICADNCDFDPEPYLIGDFNDVNTGPGSPAKARNTSLRHREKGEHIVTVDSDITFLTQGWLSALAKTLDAYGFGAVSPCIGDPGPPYFHRIAPNTGIHETLALPVGCRMYSGKVMDALGAFRSYGPYGMEDCDIDRRTIQLGYKLAYDSSVVVRHPGTPADDPWKREELKRTLPLFKRMEEGYYFRGEALYQDPDAEFDPTAW